MEVKVVHRLAPLHSVVYHHSEPFVETLADQTVRVAKCNAEE